MPDQLWERLGEVAAAAGTDRAALIREWIRWYVRDPGAKPPRRPRGPL